ncbi:MAG: NAD-dependent epimerase/dehydratase family protein [Myxococcota bacterium]
MSNQRFVVFGAGQVGGEVTRQLLAQGHRVRQVRQSGGSHESGPLEVRAGDVRDRAFAAACADGASALIHCIAPPYHRWGELLAAVNEGVLHAATTSGAPLVVLDNLYAYGRPDGALTEGHAVRPCSRKGALRAREAEKLLSAHREGRARVALGRAADFYGPGVTLTAVFGERFFGRLAKRQGAECFGPPELPHSYSFVPDVAAGLITLATAPRALGEVWHLPVAPAEPTAAVAARFGRELGFEVKTSRVPGAALRVMGLFVPAVKELLEMRYQWEAPFVLDDAKFRAAFGAQPTSLDEGVRATVRWLTTRG